MMVTIRDAKTQETISQTEQVEAREVLAPVPATSAAAACRVVVEPLGQTEAQALATARAALPTVAEFVCAAPPEQRASVLAGSGGGATLLWRGPRAEEAAVACCCLAHLQNPGVGAAGTGRDGLPDGRVLAWRAGALRTAGGWPGGYHGAELAAGDVCLRLRRARYRVELVEPLFSAPSPSEVNAADAEQFLRAWGVTWQETRGWFPPAAVSFIVPAYDHGAYLDACLDSCFAQAGVDGLVEVCVVDDGSTDDTWARLTARKAARPDEALLLLRQENSGLSAARNRGIMRGTGAVVVFQDADDVAPSDRVARTLAALQSEEADVVYGQLDSFDDGHDPANPAQRRGGRIARPPQPEHVESGCGFRVGTAAARREVFDRHEVWFDEAMAGLEDMEWFWHCLAAGLRVTMLDEVLLWRRALPHSLRTRIDVPTLRRYALGKHAPLLDFLRRHTVLPVDRGEQALPTTKEGVWALESRARMSVPPAQPQPSFPLVAILPDVPAEGGGGVAQYVRELRRHVSFPQTSDHREADLVHWNPWATLDEPDVATTHGIYLPEDWPPEQNPQYVVSNDRLLSVYRASRQVVAVSAWFRDRLEADHGIVAGHIPNGVDVSRFHPEASEDFALWVGYDDRVKRPGDLLELARRAPQLRCVAVGRGMTREVWPDAPSNLELRGELPHGEVRDLLARCRFLVMTSGREQCPTVVLEALASGKPTLAWDHYAGRDLVVNDATGRLVSPDDLPALEQAATELWETAPAMQAACLELARQYDWRRLAERWEDVYRGLWALPVTVVVLAWKNRTTLSRAIASLGRRCEVVVGDADGLHRDLVPAWCQYLRVPNDSVADNYNRCVAAGTRPFVALTDGDDYRYAETLPGQVRYLREHPEVGVVHGGLVNSLGARRLTQPGDAGPRARTDFEHGNPVPNGASLFRREAWQAVGGFYPLPYAEDYDFYWRVLDSGRGVVCRPELTYQLTSRPDSVTTTIGYDKHMAAVRTIQARGAERLARGEVKA